ncbi:MAG: Fic family protein [Candidatus Pacearchaeota archaeon]|nr:Fic family protein [Candidatus Pacearchaeota archaeon]
MVTKYDVFEVVYKTGLLRPKEIVEKLGKTEKDYKNIYRILTELENEKLLFKKEEYFGAKKEGKSKALYEIILYCLSNNINYNLLLDKNLVNFVWNGLSNGEINQKSTNLNPRTFTKYVQTLNKYGLILINSKKPLKAKIFYNTLINNLLVYFGFKHLEVKKETTDYSEEIKKELSFYNKLRKKNELGFQKIVSEFEVSFIHHSLSLEGNPITLPDTIKILKDKITPANLKTEDVDELKNYQIAILQMLQDSQQRKPLSIESVLNYHKLALAHRQEIAGKIREVEVYIKGNPNFKVSKAEDVKAELEKLFEKYNEFITSKKGSTRDILEFASYFHNEFQHIHPFVDGNSRITRLITFYLLNSMDIPIIDIPFGLLEDYLEQTKGSKSRNDKALQQSLSRIILFNLKKINERLEG